MGGIGLLNEKPLHASLKQWCAQPGDRFEVSLDGFVIDIVRDGLLLEIQTGSFTPLKSKLTKLVNAHKTRLIYPIAQERWIVKKASTKSGRTTRRKSPRRGRVEDVFWEAVSFPHLLAHPNFSIEVLLIKEEEVRRYAGKRRAWRRKGWVIEERRLLEVVERRLFQADADFRALLPATVGESFTTGDIAHALRIRRPLAQKMAFCLRHANIINQIGKRGNAILYTRTTAQRKAS